MPRNDGTRGPADMNLTASVALVDQLQRAVARQNRDGVVGSIRQLLAKRVPMGAQWQQIAFMASDYGELTLSRRAMERYVEAAGKTPVAQYQQAGLLVRNGALKDAYALLNALPQDAPDPAVNAYSRGAAAVVVDEASRARELLERATQLRPELAQAWLPLSTLIDFAEEPVWMDRLLTAGRQLTNAPPGVRAAHCYALGKAYIDQGEHKLAFEAFATGGQLKKIDDKYDRERDRASADAATRGYDAQSIAAVARQQRENTGRSIFVTGLPRSGTTLVEQILASHSAVSDGAEINRLRMLAREVGGQDHAALSRHVAEHGTAPAARLWLHWLRERFPRPGRVIDKSVDTSRYLGLAAALLPEAPVIWMTRNTLDCAWSCFRTHFMAGVPWSHDLEDIAYHFRLEDQLLQEWQPILGERLLVVPYEDLVADPTSWIRRILGHCGLPEQPAVFAPHENRRPVMTSSVLQVRRPINGQAIGSAEPYRESLQPFLKAYEA